MHINCNEILAAFLRLQTFGKDKREIPIQLRVDNTTTMYYINHMGGHTLCTDDAADIQPVGLEPEEKCPLISRASSRQVELHCGLGIQDAG